MGLEQGIFNRTELLFGPEKMEQLASATVIIFGIGGVGSWCAESLVRSGIRHLTIVDSDRICITNINRQLHATTLTVGEVKTDALRKRLLEINPHAEITAIQKIYTADNRDLFELDSYDYIIDAIDSLSSKVDLIRSATKTNAVFFSSMGAALKIDPTRIRVAEFWKVKGDPLAACIRRLIRKGEMPGKKFLCVYSEEVLSNKGVNKSCGTVHCLCPKNRDAKGDQELANHEWCSKKAAINGTLAHITAIFGFTLAGLVMEDIYYKDKAGRETVKEQV
ncbi:MAG: tRNA threonylcarbamoyladenosine dehydratase [Bacteroidota bacterium]|nr:tRNA threonylcarbamoyladenosine dehydratase [Bacteroidota bacterium]